MAAMADTAPGSTQRSPLTVLKRGLFLVIAGLLAWRMVTLGLSAHYARQPTFAAQDSALAWRDANPDALYWQGRRVLETDPAQAEARLRQAALANPADGRAFAALGLLRERQGQAAQAVALLEAANRLGPNRLDVQTDRAAFWLRQGRLDQAMGPLSLILQADPDRRETVFPGLLQLADNPKTRAALISALKDLPPWWGHFFAYASAQAKEPDTVRRLYEASGADGRSVSTEVRRHYLGWLQRGNQWAEAHAVWSAGLPAGQREAAGLIFDGGFEFPFSNEIFGWQATPVAGVDMETLTTYGAKGDKALRVKFRGLRTPFYHLAQFLLLRPGSYELTGLARVDNLQAAEGVQWTLYCAAGKQQKLGISERFRGVSDWRRFTVPFKIPATGCPAQLLQLELAGKVALDFEARGSVWFDDLTITPAN